MWELKLYFYPSAGGLKKKKKKVGGSIPGVLPFFFGVPFFLISFVGHRVWFHNRVRGPDVL